MFGLNFAKVVGPLKRSNDLHRRMFHSKDGEEARDEMKEVRLWETWKRHARSLFKCRRVSGIGHKVDLLVWM